MDSVERLKKSWQEKERQSYNRALNASEKTPPMTREGGGYDRNRNAMPHKRR